MLKITQVSKTNYFVSNINSLILILLVLASLNPSFFTKASFCTTEKSYDFKIPLCDASLDTSNSISFSCYTLNGFTTCNTLKFKDNQILNSPLNVYMLNTTIFSQTMDFDASLIDKFESVVWQDMTFDAPDYINYTLYVHDGDDVVTSIYVNKMPIDVTTLVQSDNSIMFRPFSAKYNFKEKFNSFSFFSRTSETLKRQVDVVVTFDQPNLIVNFPVTGDYSVWVDKAGFNEVFYISNSSVIELSTNFFINDSPITVYIYRTEVQIFTASYEVSAATYCPYPVNPFNSWSDTWHCMGNFGKFAIICFWVGMVAFAFVGLFLLVVVLYYLACFYKWMTRANMTINNNNNNIKLNYDADDEDLSDDEEIKLRQIQKDKATKKKNALQAFRNTFTVISLINPALIMKIVVLALLLAPAIAVDLPPCNTTAFNTTYPELTCQYTYSIDSTSFVCNAGVCSIVFNHEITIGYPGQTGCINFLDSLGNIMTTLYIRYTGSKFLTKFNYNYFTSKWSPVYQSDKSCPGAETFCTLSGCPVGGTLGYNNSRAQVFNQYNSLALRAPMTSACQASCGCASCGCFFCNSGCLWYYYGFLPVNDTAGNPPLPVFLPGQTYNYPIVEGYFRNPEKNCWDSPFLPSFAIHGPVGSAIIPQVFSTADLTGSNIPYKLNVVIKSQVLIEFPAWGNACFFCPSDINFLFPGGCRVGPCSPTNGPIAGLPGDIQFQTVNTTGYPQPPFRWLPTSVQTSATDQYMNFIFPPSGWDTMMSYPQVGNGVSSYAGQKWILKYQAFEADTIGQGPLTLGISSYAPFNVSYTDTSVCPTCSFNGITGCSSCPLGALINITSRSTCFAGAVTLLFEGPLSLQTRSLVITTSDEFYLINTFANVPNIVGTLTICDKDQCSSCSVNGYVPVYEEVTYGNYTPGKNDSSIITTGDFGDWWFSLDGIWAWLKWVLAVIGGIVVITAIILSIVGIVVLALKISNSYTPIQSTKLYANL